MEKIEQWIEEIKQGNLDRFEDIIIAYQQQLYRYCLRISGDPHDAEDLVQDSFIKAYQKLSSYRYSLSFSAWLYRITYNNCINHLRRKALIRFIPFGEEHTEESNELQTILEADSYSQEVAQALSKLSAQDRALLSLRIDSEMDYEEISMILGISAIAARKRFERAKKRIKQEMSSKGGVLYV